MLLRNDRNGHSIVIHGHLLQRNVINSHFAVMNYAAFVFRQVQHENAQGEKLRSVNGTLLPIGKV